MSGRTRLLLANLAVAAGYILYSIGGQALLHSRTAVPVVAGGVGFALGAAIAWGPRIGAGLFVGAAVGAGFWARSQGAALEGPVVAVVLVAAATRVALCLAGGALLRRLVPPERLFTTVRGVLSFILLGGLLVAALAAVLSLLAVHAAGLARVPFAEGIRAMAIASSAAVMLLGPLLVLFRNGPALPRRPVEAAACGAAIAVASAWVFGPHGPLWLGHAPVHFLIPPLLWACLRFGARGVALALVTVAAAAVFTTGLRYDPAGLDQALGRLQLALEVLAATFLLLAAMLHERHEARVAIEAERSDLERRVEATASELQAERDFGNLVIENSGAFVGLLDLDGRVVRINKAFERATGWRTDDILGMPYDALRPKGRLPPVPDWVERVKRGELVRLADAQVTDSAGGIIEGELAAAPIRGGPSGEITAILVTAIDVTERNRARREREASLSVLQATLESTADGLVAIDLQGRIVASNTRFAELWGIAEEELREGRPASEVARMLRPLLEDQAAFEASVRWREEHPDRETEDVLRLVDGRIFERFTRPQFVAGEVVGRVVGIRDATRRRRAEQERDRLIEEEGRARRSTEIAYNREEEAIRFRDDFLAAASRQMVPPLAATRSEIDRLGALAGSASDGVPVDEIRGPVEDALRQLGAMQGVVDELLRIPEEPPA